VEEAEIPMITRWFKEPCTVFRRLDASDWSASAFAQVVTVYAFVQPAGGGIGTKNGAVNANASYTMYCPADSDILIGDRITDSASRNYIVTDTQQNGISGNNRHCEIGMELEKL
jgi:hypothetical protein